MGPRYAPPILPYLFSSSSPFQCCSPSTPSPNVNDVQAWPSSGTSSQPSSAPLELDASSLPAGWHPSSSSSSKTESTIILIISIVLAVFLCVFMIACVCWRRSKKKKRDIELKLKHKLKVDDESEIGDQEKEAQNKMRIWARATARWKAHIRLSARRRRKRQIAVARGPRPQSSVLSDRPGESVDSLPRRSRQPSPSPSAVQNTQPVATTTATDIPESPALTPDTESQPEPSLPPAYNPDVAQRSHSTIPDHANSLDLSPPLSRQSPFPDTETPPLSHATPGPCIPPATGHVSTAPPLSHAAPGPYIPPATGHVSTDDKSHLRSLEEQASAPPDPAATTPSGIPAVVVSVPTWDEMLNELDGFPELECYSPRTPVYIPPNFPPPPSKAAMASNYHEDTDDLTDDDGSFTPSAPPGDHLDVEPSAPSLEDEGGNEVMDMVVDQTNGHLSHTPPLVVPSVRPSCLTCRTPSSFSHGIPPSYRP